MKPVKLFFATTSVCAGIVLTGLVSCSKGSSDGPAAPPAEPKTIQVSLTRDTIQNNGFESVQITVKDVDGSNISGSALVYADGVLLNSDVYYPTAAKNVTFVAKKGTLTSKDKILVVQDPGASPFTQKMLIEDCTGTWCGYCPRIAFSVEDFKSTHPACISVGIHGGGGGTEPFTYLYGDALFNGFGITQFPTAVINRKVSWNENDALDTYLKQRAPLGLAIQSTVSGGSITGKVQVKYDVTTDVPMKVLIMLVEDGLKYDQVNYYAPTFGANPIAGFTQKNVLRQIASSDVLRGSDIPVSAQVRGNTWEQTFNFTTTGSTGIGTSYTVVPANTKVVAAVLYGTNTLSKKGAVNVQEAQIGTTKSFD